MADADGATTTSEKSFAVDTPADTSRFYLKGLAHLGWGMKNRLSRIFNPKSGRTLMLAFDHGYIMGPTTGLERLDLVVPPLTPHVDCLMCTRGGLQTSIAPETNLPLVLRSSAGATVLKELSYEAISVTLEDAIRLNASAVTCQVHIGDEYEHNTLKNLSYLISEGNRYGIPTLGVTAVGKQMVRDSRYLGLATRVVAELGAHVVKTYYCESGFDEVVAGCPVPIVIAGGKKLPELDALEMAWKAIDQGAAGVDMGRNIFGAEDPAAMAQAVRGVIHENMKTEEAFDLFNTLKAENAKQ